MGQLGSTGTDLASEQRIPALPWLDPATNRYLRRLIALAVSANPEVEAVILFGSAARRTLRPMSDPEPSDVDVLFVMTAAPDAPQPGYITREQHLAISRAAVTAYPATFDPTIRPVQTVIADPSFAGWDLSFVENVARDGLLLWAKDAQALPAMLAGVALPPPR